MSDSSDLFSDQWDPYELLGRHDQWIQEIAEHLQRLAEAGSATSQHLEQNINLVRQLVRGYEHMNQRIRYLEERINRLENPQ